MPLALTAGQYRYTDHVTYYSLPTRPKSPYHDGHGLLSVEQKHQAKILIVGIQIIDRFTYGSDFLSFLVGDFASKLFLKSHN